MLILHKNNVLIVHDKNRIDNRLGIASNILE